MMARHREYHKLDSVSWLRAAVLGANDGIVSTASLILGVAAAQAAPQQILVAGVAALVAGSMSMAAGEFVSVQSQADAEDAAFEKERGELKDNPAGEHVELARIYMDRGVDAAVATEVARQLMAHDALGAHARDELGLTDALKAKPLEAAFASAASFAGGALLPLMVAYLAPTGQLILPVALASLLCLALLGGLAARAGGASVLRGALRVCFWSAAAMGVTAGIGAAFGTIA